MEDRGPHEGAPGPLDHPLLEKPRDLPEIWTSNPTTSLDHRKTPNRLLFLTVEFSEDQSKDFNRMFPYEQVSFSPRATSPLDFEHRVSPLDPNMSSTARYSPTPVQLPSLPFQNPQVVLQSPPSPLIQPQETNQRGTMNFIETQGSPPNISSSEAESVSDFVSGESQQGISHVNGELILMQEPAEELEHSPPPLMLSGLTSTDFALARDFLVMNDDQLTVITPLSSSSEDPAVVPELSSLPDPEKDMLSDSITYPPTLPPKKPLTEEENLQSATDIPQKSTNRQINDKKTFWCDDCDTISLRDGECTCHNVQTIADQPVPSRAVATLPGSHLSLRKLNSPQGALGVFAKRNICRRTQFGPIEGVPCEYDGKGFSHDALPLLYETDRGEFIKIDVSNEHSSNWMRFVRPAQNYREQNLIISQQKEGIIFLTTRNISPREELRAGPSPDYATRRGLPLLEDPKTQQFTSGHLESFSSLDSPFNDYSNRPPDLQVSSSLNSISEHPQPQEQAKRTRMGKSKLLKTMDEQSLLYKCSQCPKAFPRNDALKKHLLSHSGSTSAYECPTCGENFLHSYNRSRHIKIFHSNDAKEKENSRKSSEYKCSKCSLIFMKASLLELHSELHNKNNNESLDEKRTRCPQCKHLTKSHLDLVKHVSKHGHKYQKHKLTKTSKVTVLSSHKCTMCYKRFATKVRLQQHYLVHGAEDQKPLPCNVCFKRFMNNSALSCHLKTHREDKQIFECPMCCKLFNQVLQLKDHIETHRNDDKTFTCSHCPRTFTKYSVIRKHIRAHHCERKHKCQFCVKRFPTIDKLRMHLLRHSDHRQFHCANCEKQFKRKDKLKEHMTRMHSSQRMERMERLERTERMESAREQSDVAIDNGAGNQGNQSRKFIPKVNPTDYNRFVYKCHQCLVGFKRRGMLVNHLAKRHPEVPPESIPELNLPILRQTRDYYCQYCDKVYKSSSKRKAHIVKNHPGAALPPSNRQKEMMGDSTYSQAAGSVTTTPQSCQWCHKQYASKAKLLQHQRKKHSTLMEPADQVPRARNRQQAQLQVQQDLIDNNFGNNNFEFIEIAPVCDIDAPTRSITLVVFLMHRMLNH
ncbi:PR domain zinc finger protein 10 isoform X2 [Fopius arisanus]|uniref:PR domain zinc finger protein 10 isoform X2 n=1 Tax=Fopius arisanus TaxID=64838 RepID=A0A9R1SZU0_9HYME|nr:PREDICTED: PR domain zinc finger protein 10-like isoform X2 [Fopius arisanus]